MLHTSKGFPYINLCHNPFYCQLAPFTCFIHYPFLWRTQLQLNKKVKIFVYFAINDNVVLCEWGKPSASNSNCAVWVEIWKHLRNAIDWCLKEWDLDSISVFVTVTIKQTRTAAYSQVALNYFSVDQHILTQLPFLIVSSTADNQQTKV
jgi:hypothetical protein